MRWSNSPSLHDSGSKWKDVNDSWGKVAVTLEEIADIGTCLLTARWPLRTVDKLALGMKSAKVLTNIYREWKSEEATVRLDEYFQGAPWQIVNYSVAAHAFQNIEIEEKLIKTHATSRNGKLTNAAWIATVQGVQIGWVGPPNMASMPIPIYCAAPDKVRDLAASRLWEMAGCDNILRVKDDQTFPVVVATDFIETEFVRNLESRVRRFLGAKSARAVLMDGQPGAGKTSSAAYLAKKFNLRTVVIDAIDFTTRSASDVQLRGNGLVQMLRPEAIVVNDIDRLEVGEQLELLDLLDNAKQYAKLIFATTNHYRGLIEPIRRPGRLDDFVSVPGLTLEEIRKIAPDAGEYTERMLDWPIAYVCDVQKRFDVLGHHEFEEVERRLTEIREDGSYAIKYDPPAEAPPKQRVFDMRDLSTAFEGDPESWLG